MQKPKEILAQLGLADSEIEIYLAMQKGIVRVRDIVKVTGRKRPTVYYAIDCLEKRGLLSKSGVAGDGQYQVDPKHLVTLAEEKKKESERSLEKVAELAAFLFETAQSKNEKPSVAFFEGVDAVKSVVMETLYCRSKLIRVVAPTNNFFRQVGPEFLERYIDLRGKRGVNTKSLWENPTDVQTYKRYYEGLSDIKIVPAVMHGQFQSTVFLYDDKTLYISSLKNGYCILVTSKEHHDTMSAWFEGLWNASKAHKPARK